MKKFVLAIIIVLVVAAVVCVLFFVQRDRLMKNAAEEALNYLQANLLQSGITASIKETAIENGLVKVIFSTSDNSEYTSFVTLDGKTFFPSAVDLTDKSNLSYVKANSVENPFETGTVAPADMKKYVACLKKAGLIVYGDKDCTYTQQVITALGGEEIIKPIYVECSTDREGCRAKGVNGYPTIMINGVENDGTRSFASFSNDTGCAIPEGINIDSGDNSDNSCQ